MDDLDHSIHIAEYDWITFCEESEECSLLKPSIACSDSSGLSDSEDSESSSPEQLNKTRTGEENDEKSLAKLDCDICSVCSAVNTLSTTEVHVKAAEETKATNNNTESPHKLKKEVRLLETEVDNYRSEAAPSFVDQTDVNGNEPPATEAALSRVHARAEKERWFVTVNDRPARQQAAAVSVKKKTRQKQPRKNSWSTNQETSVENSLMMKDKNDSEGGRDKRGFVQLKQPLVQKPGEVPSAQINLELPLMCRKNETVSEILLTNSLTEPIAEATMGRNTHDPGSVSRDVFSLEAPSHMETAESDEFCSIHSYDSESYLSAAESTEEPLYHLKDHVTENQQPLLLTTSQAPDRGLLHCDNTLSCNVSATKCDGYEGTGAEPTLAVPYAGQRANEMPGDNSTCDKDTHGRELCVSSHTLQNQDTHLSASGSSSGHQLSPCSVTNSSGTYAEAAGLTGPVYAMSAFWNEMEKMTINDILRLRVGGSTQTQETVTPSVHGFPANHTLRAECNPSDGPMDTSDVSDSDYFTQPDESKPDCSSCEFSTSDFEEDYWQFIGASRNPSPDPQGKNHPNTTGSAFLCHEELLCTRCEEKDPHVPSEACAGQRVDHHESHTLMKPFQLGGITKTQTLNTEELTSQSLFGVDENSLFLSHSQALEENLALKQNNSLETLIPSPVLSSTDMLDKRYQISIAEAFEFFFTEDEAKNDTHGTVYNHEDISVTPVRDCTLCTFRNEMPFSALHDSQCSKEKPIPIFSCSHPTVRDLTFPKPSPLFLNAHSENEDISPALPRFLSQESLTWKSLLSISNICFHTKGSTWCRRSGAWVFPVDAEKRKDPQSAAITEGRFHWRIWETLHSRQEGVFSTLKQSDMCLVCIAFASWVLRSSNPEAADAWKAALLANVSALSAIQFLRHYVKKTPLLDDP